MVDPLIKTANNGYFEYVKLNKDGKFFEKQISQAKKMQFSSGFKLSGSLLLILASAALIAVYLSQAHGFFSLPNQFHVISTLGVYNFAIAGVSLVLGSGLTIFFSLRIHRTKRINKEYLSLISGNKNFHEAFDKAFEYQFYDAENLNLFDFRIRKNNIQPKDYENLDKMKYRIFPYEKLLPLNSMDRQFVIVRKEPGRTMDGILTCSEKVSEEYKDQIVKYLEAKGYEEQPQ